MTLTLILGILLLAAGPAPTALQAAPYPKAEAANQSLDASPDWNNAIQADLREREYQVTWQEQSALPGLNAAYQAPNRAHNLRAYFTPQGLTLVPRTSNSNNEASSLPSLEQGDQREKNGNWQLSLSLAGYGYSNQLQALPEPTLTVVGNEVTYDYGSLTEWYRNDETGLKHGFTLNQPPQAQPATADTPLVLKLALQTDLTPTLSADGQSLTLTDGARQTRLTYDQLQV